MGGYTISPRLSYTTHTFCGMIDAMKPLTSPSMVPVWRHALMLALVLMVALINRVSLLTVDVMTTERHLIPLHSDEALVGLMARHIAQGQPIPTFFYGQAYMGTVDAAYTALWFRAFGDSILVLRIAQSALYLALVAMVYGLGWLFTRNLWAATAAALWWAVPTQLITLQTTVTLGGYGEILLLCGAVLALAHRISGRISGRLDAARTAWVAWIALGLCGGVGWYINGLMAVPLLTVALFLLWRLWATRKTGPAWRARVAAVLLAGVMFIVGGAPWWWYNLTNDWQALALFVPSLWRQDLEYVRYNDDWTLTELGRGGLANTDTSFVDRALGLLLFGVPTLVGLRAPWSSEYFAAWAGFAVLLVSIAAVYSMARGNTLDRDGRALLLGLAAVMFGVFLFSPFGQDPSGRYLLPLALVVALALGGWLARLPFTLGLLLLCGVLTYHEAGQYAALQGPLGITTQFNPVTNVPTEDDAALIDFLTREGLTHGYTQHWLAFRLAFRSQERVQYSPILPYIPNLVYKLADNRYPPYTVATAQAQTRGERIAYLTANMPEFDALLRRTLAAQNISYRTEQIGPFTIYYDFSADLRPPTLDLLLGLAVLSRP
jgi:4-amino-4-deoxy-L-arabinose transferase-like glycosyltransferase